MFTAAHRQVERAGHANLLWNRHVDEGIQVRVTEGLEHLRGFRCVWAYVPVRKRIERSEQFGVRHGQRGCRFKFGFCRTAGACGCVSNKHWEKIRPNSAKASEIWAVQIVAMKSLKNYIDRHAPPGAALFLRILRIGD